jgi:hypothetical protein
MSRHRYRRAGRPAAPKSPAPLAPAVTQGPVPISVPAPERPGGPEGPTEPARIPKRTVLRITL